MPKFFATCPKGFEQLLFNELVALQTSEVKETLSGVYFTSSLEKAIEVCFKSRFASRVLHILSRFYCQSDTELYMGALGIAWEDYFECSKTIAVDFTGSNAYIRNTQYGALRIKDGVCDRFMQTQKQRPNVDKDAPQIRIVGHLHHEEAVICIDLGGFALHQRHIARGTGIAPIKENLACAMLTRAGFDGTSNLLDPMCGSGTILIEAAMLATNMAVGLHRDNYGFFNLKLFNTQLKAYFDDLVNKAKVDFQEGLARAQQLGIKIIGFDAQEHIVQICKENLHKAGLESICEVHQCEIKNLYNPFANDKNCFVVTNPPYGVRMGNFNSLICLYNSLGAKLKEHFINAKAAIISSSNELLSCLKLKYDKSYKLYNGQLLCALRIYNIEARDTQKQEDVIEFKNRLKKNLKALKKFIANQDTDCYRIYDADIPMYKAAIDYYAGNYVLYEYAATKDVDPHKVREHLYDMIAAVQEVCEVPGEQIIVKSRQKQQGSNQYEGQEQKQNEFICVHEANLKYYVNLHDYLDTGIFLDARNIRELIFNNAKDKDFLNLFCYTATATVAAAVAGAKQTLSVDMSNTYLDWAVRNFKLNNISFSNNRLMQQDCLYFLSHNCTQKFDLVYLDPPTFSNSKRMEGILDIVRDHVKLLANLTLHLKDQATVYFCTNKRNFKIDEQALVEYGYSVENYTHKSIPFDFKQQQNIHSFFILQFDRTKLKGEIEPLVSNKALPRWSKSIGERKTIPSVSKNHSSTKEKTKFEHKIKSSLTKNATPRKRRVFGPMGVSEE